MAVDSEIEVECDLSSVDNIWLLFWGLKKAEGVQENEEILSNGKGTHEVKKTSKENRELELNLTYANMSQWSYMAQTWLLLIQKTAAHKKLESDFEKYQFLVSHLGFLTRMRWENARNNGVDANLKSFIWWFQLKFTGKLGVHEVRASLLNCKQTSTIDHYIEEFEEVLLLNVNCIRMEEVQQIFCLNLQNHSLGDWLQTRISSDLTFTQMVSILKRRLESLPYNSRGFIRSDRKLKRVH